MKVRKVRLLHDKYHWKPKFKVGDVIRRRPLKSYNYEQPVQKIVAIRENVYVFAQKPLALEIFAQDEWQLYDTWWRRLRINTREFFKKIFRYHQPSAYAAGLKTKHVGRQNKVPGHSLFMYNRETGEIKPAPVIAGTVMMQDGWIYQQALNKKNAIKKLKRKGII